MVQTTTQQKNIRSLDTRKDLLAVADLIEICFGPQLDPDGLAYLKQIRRAGTDPHQVRWSYAAGELVSYPLNGYVYEMEGRVVGNLSLIPFYWKRQWYYLIANVAVHPDFRQQGIARALTSQALEHLKRLPISSVWLHVREDNQPARRLYDSFHFSERSRRSTWLSTPVTDNLDGLVPGVTIESIHREDWTNGSKWLAQLYPPEVAWHLGFDATRYKPGFLSNLLQYLNGAEPVQWAARVHGKLSAAAILEKSYAYADPVFLALPPDGVERSITALLPYIKVNHSPQRLLVVNYPAHTADQAFLQAGFELVSTLIWMEIRIN